MKITDYVLLSVKALLRNKLRAFLSMLGIIFGVATLVATISIAEGTKRSILKTVESLGTNLVVVVSTPVKGSVGLQLKDISAIEQFATSIQRITPLIIRPGSISYQNITLPVSLIGTSADYPVIRKHPVLHGRFIQEEDVKQVRKICVLERTAAQKLFKPDNGLKQIITINTGSFENVGVMQQKEKSLFSAYQNIIFLPVTTLQELYGLEETIAQILIESKSSETVYQTMAEVNNILFNFHNEIKDFDIWCQEDLLKQKERVTKIFKIALGSIALISLLIGGIGIMNVMLASVNERIKEIGIKKALGASAYTIMTQFIFESLILSLTGGIIGIMVGSIMGKKIAGILTTLIPYEGPEWQAVVTFDSIQIAFLFTLLTGFFFGLYPARRASRLDPCEALTYE